MRPTVLVAALALTCAACAGPEIAASAARSLAAQADEVAASLARGDLCDAAGHVRRLRVAADGAIASGAVPEPLAADLDRRVAALEDVRCPPPSPRPTPTRTSEDRKDDDKDDGEGERNGNKDDRRGKGKGGDD